MNVTKNDLKSGQYFGSTEQIISWLGWRDSNPRMPVPKTGALPLGDIPLKIGRIVVVTNLRHYSENWLSGLVVHATSDVKELFKRGNALNSHLVAQFGANIPDVPRFVLVAGHGLLVGGVADDKSVAIGINY
jgi:hypothetical protein